MFKNSQDKSIRFPKLSVNFCESIGLSLKFVEKWAYPYSLRELTRLLVKKYCAIYCTTSCVKHKALDGNVLDFQLGCCGMDLESGGGGQVNWLYF